MISSLNSYPSMKNSGVPWLGQVPEHWAVHRLKTDTLNVIDQAKTRGLDEMYIALEHVESWTGRIREADPDIIFDSQVRRFQAGDVLFGKLRPYLAKVTRPVRNGVCVGEFMVLRPRNNEHDARYLEQVLRSKPAVDVINASTFGAKMPRADWTYVGALQLPVPPLREQRGIVKFLDHVDRRIRRYIRAKQKLIKLLEEQKQAIIHQAVTRGLDPNVRLKPSGVEWLGDIPEHWEVKRSKRLFTRRKEIARQNDIQLSATQAYGVIPQEEYERRVGRKVVKILLHLDKRSHVETDDFVISMRSFQGGLERAWASGCIRSSYVVLRSTTDLDVGFFSYVFKSYAYIKALQATADFIRDGQDLNFGNFSAVDLPFPPLEEQRQIMVSLCKSIAKSVSTSERTQAEIDLLKEYRTRLIADVVTGKVDVREVAAGLPDESVDSEILDEEEIANGDSEDGVASELDPEVEEIEV